MSEGNILELTSTEAAHQLGVSVQTWHRLARSYSLTPARQANGMRGARWWRVADVERVGRDRQAAS